MSFTDLPQSYSNPFLFPVSILLGVMSDSVPNLLGTWKPDLLESSVAVKRREKAKGFARGLSLCPAALEAKALSCLSWCLLSILSFLF